jgi:hypothetical protein
MLGQNPLFRLVDHRRERIIMSFCTPFLLSDTGADMEKVQAFVIYKNITSADARLARPVLILVFVCGVHNFSARVTCQAISTEV